LREGLATPEEPATPEGSAALKGLATPGAQHVAELSARLIEVTATVELLARTGKHVDANLSPISAGLTRSPDELVGEDEKGAQAQTAQTGEDSAPAQEADVPPGQLDSGRPALTAVLVDEREPETSIAPGQAADGSEISEIEEISIKDERGEHRREGALIDVPGLEQSPVQDGGGEGRDGAEERTPWIAAIARRLERYERDRTPFAALLLELVDVERLRYAELPGEVARLTGLLETVLAEELRPADSLMRESPGRYWLLAPETNSPNARSLAARLSAAVYAKVSHRGAPLVLAVGIAVCPADGERAGALAAHADIALYAARASGRPLAP
jgi:GGDEF domain-containing protein